MHAKVATSEGYKNIIIKSTDTYLVVIGVTLFNDLNLKNLWIAFSRGKSFRWVPIHEISLSLGQRANTLTLFTHSLVVIQCLPFVVKVRNLHGKFGMYLKKQQGCSENMAMYQKLYQMMINKFLSSLLLFYMIDPVQLKW